MDIKQLIRGSYRKDTSVSSISYSPEQMQTTSQQLARGTPITQTSIKISQRGRTPYQGITAPSIQPTAPRIWTTPITTRAISAPVSPTALGRTPSIMSAATLGGGAVAPASSSDGGGLISNIGSGISDIIQKYMPIAIKVVIAIVAIKVLWWLLRGRR